MKNSSSYNRGISNGTGNANHVSTTTTEWNGRRPTGGIQLDVLNIATEYFLHSLALLKLTMDFWTKKRTKLPKNYW